MYKDYTLKARVSSQNLLEGELKKLNARFLGVDHQTDTYFQTSIGKLKLRQGTIENLITHYERTFDNGVEKTTVHRYDVNPTEAEVEKLKDSHKQIGTVIKERKIYFIDHLKIHLDKLQNGEEFIEIEAIDRHNEFSDEELKNQCMALKDKLGIRESEMVKTGYLTK